jgi:hypothetical protein
VAGVGALLLLAVPVALVATREAPVAPNALGTARRTAAPAGRPPAGDDPSPERRALAVLRAWDDRRADAYAEGSESRLASLYVPRSSAGAADVRLLRAYSARRVRVRGMHTQVLALSVLDRGRDRLRVVVTDRLTGARAVRAGGETRLPRDSATSRVVTLVRAPGAGWRVATVR